MEKNIEMGEQQGHIQNVLYAYLSERNNGRQIAVESKLTVD
jgi:hypothetical protein